MYIVHAFPLFPTVFGGPAPLVLPRAPNRHRAEQRRERPRDRRKYYTKTVARNYGKDSFHAANINQIFHYVMLMAKCEDNAGKTVSGMLLYAKTKDTPFASEQWEDCGHAFEAKTLDLGVPFDDIRTQLDAIADGL